MPPLHHTAIPAHLPVPLLHKRRRLPDDDVVARDTGWLPTPKRRCSDVLDDGDLDLVLLDPSTDEDDLMLVDGDLAPHLQWHLPRLELHLGSTYVPKEGEHPKGEDAHFLSEERNAFGIADGVGSWTRRGIDAGKFARQLMRFCKHELEEGTPCRSSVTSTRLQGVLESALARTTARGSSTAVIAAVDGQLLRAVNVGDSGFLVVRGDELVFRSPSDQRSFNRPYQLGGVDARDPPVCPRRLEVQIEPGDVIVGGTDGLFDNLFVGEIQEIVARALVDGHEVPKEIARQLAFAAVEAYVGEEATPFTLARREAGLPWSGGKADDVTVVVAIVQ